MKRALCIVAGLCVGLALGYVLRPGDVEGAIPQGYKLGEPVYYLHGDTAFVLYGEDGYVLTERDDDVVTEYSTTKQPDIALYDPNDPIYKFIPPAPEDWVEKFGDSERTRLMHSVSELRVVVAQLGRRVMALEDPNGVTE